MKTLWESFCEQYQSRSSFTQNSLDEARRKAESFIKTNPKKDLYPVEYDRPEDDMELCFLLPMSEEELELVKRLKEWNEEEENDELETARDKFYDSLIDRTVFPFYDSENPWLVKEIGDKPEHTFKFTAAVLKDRDKPAKLSNVGVPLEDEEYIVLLAWGLFHRSRQDSIHSFNRLRDELPGLYDKITRHIENAVGDFVIREENPYAVFMDEMEENIAEIEKNDAK